MRTPLGFDASGNPIDVPESATAWRVRRALGRPGRPQTVYDPDTGRQLELPITATLDDLRDCGCGPARYRLEAIDAESKALVPAVVAFVEVVETSDEDPEEPQMVGVTPRDLVSGNRAMKTVERQADALCRVAEAMARAFGPVQPAGGADLAELAQLAQANAAGAGGTAPTTPNFLTPDAIQAFGLLAQQLMGAWQTMKKAGES